MTNRPPLPGTYDPKDWKCPQCQTLNFKKRMSCLACATAKPPRQQEVLKDWRTGKKDLGDNVLPDWTCRVCGQFNMAAKKNCEHCQKPCPPQTEVQSARDTVEGRTGRSAGHFDRPDPEEQRNAWNSDDEDFDEFGRKKRGSKKAPDDKGAAAGAKKPSGGASLSEKQRAALERLKAKGAGGSANGGSRRGDGGRQSRSRSRSGRR